MTLIRSLSFVRLALVPLALIKLLLDREDFPSVGYERAAWTLLGIHLALSLVLIVLAYSWRARLRYLALLGVVTDFALTSALMFVYAWEPAQPLRALHFLVVLEAALFFRLIGGVIAGAATLPVLLALDVWRQDQFGVPIRYDAMVLRVIVALALGAVVGRLVDMERSQARAAEDRARTRVGAWGIVTGRNTAAGGRSRKLVLSPASSGVRAPETCRIVRTQRISRRYESSGR